ncbi:MAG TPA: DUF3566 domain-containing protein [Actinomycetota bacterium]|nr:DUF3566 domain-containing protein [Actinomycetota bacterium]
MSDPADQATVVPPAPAPAPAEARARVVRGRTKPARARSRQARVVLRKVDPWSVLKISFVFYLCMMVVILGALMILYGILGAMGVLDTATEFLVNLGFGDDFQIHGNWLFSRGLAIGLVLVVLWTLINVFIVFLYNLLSDVVGGIEVTLSERR